MLYEINKENPYFKLGDEIESNWDNTLFWKDGNLISNGKELDYLLNNNILKLKTKE